ncbi:MAG: site-specific tyrosine recombinase [Porphyromonas sp.]|nr:site-specific tyrosine recombinase [Porphyromonas sp.]
MSEQSFIEIVEDFQDYLVLERHLSEHTLEGYTKDVQHLIEYGADLGVTPLDMEYKDLEGFLAYLADMGLGRASMARTISGVKSFYRFLSLEGILEEDPSQLLESPGKSRPLPEVLTVEEVDRILSAIDLSTDNGVRNAAILELLYSCGLRVSEACQLTFPSLFLEEGFVRVLGKGSKERLVPMSRTAISRIEDYLPIRQEIEAKPGYTHHLFLSRNRVAISRQMVFMVIKELAKEVGIEKEISPHTFRHSFATHLLEGGAPLQAIRDMLGHASIATTEIYTHIDRTHLVDEILTHHPRNK